MASPRGRMWIAQLSAPLAIVGAIVLSMALASPVNAAAGDLDSTFGIGGRVTTNFTSREDVAYPVALQADGRIVVAGTSAFGTFALARYETDGSLDTSFGEDGKVITNFGSGEDIAYGLVIQSDGKIVAAGTSGYAEFALARYQTDGSLDPTFGEDGKLTTDFTPYPDDGLAVAIQAEGKIVVVGGAGFGAPNETFALARYDTDGSLDTSFGGDGKVTTDFTPRPDVAFSVAIQFDGKIVAAGASQLGAGNPKFALARYNPDGSLDTSFGGDGKVTTDFTRGDDDAYSLAFQADGTIVVAGQAGSRNTKFALARYETDGSLDPTFGGDGKLTTDFTRRYDSVYQVVIQADGKIVAAGTAGFARFALARYLAA